jgi:hypothetical protein
VVCAISLIFSVCSLILSLIALSSGLHLLSVRTQNQSWRALIPNFGGRLRSSFRDDCPVLRYRLVDLF